MCIKVLNVRNKTKLVNVSLGLSLSVKFDVYICSFKFCFENIEFCWSFTDTVHRHKGELFSSVPCRSFIKEFLSTYSKLCQF